MIKIYNYNQIMQNEIEEFILNNIGNELKIKEKTTFENITQDLSNIEKNYINNGGKLLFAYDTQNKEIAGTIAMKFENNIAVLKRFYVDEKYRKKKIGYLLYMEIEKALVEANIEQVYLTSGKELEQAHKFYKRNGWKMESKNPGIYIRTGADLYKKQVDQNKINNKTVDRANILIEAIPYIKEYLGTTMVIKYGGNALVDKEQKENVIKQIALLKMLGIKVVVVHGGGPDIDEELEKENIEIKFENGLRITDKKTMDVVKNVLINKTNPSIVQLLNEQKCNAIRMAGCDDNFITCTKIDEKLGFVGQIKNIKVDLINEILEKNCVPVISPIGIDEKGNYYNINADIAAAEVAMALKAQKVIFLTNTDGVLDKSKKLISLMNKEKINLLIEDGTIIGGMIPKINACKICLNNGVEKTHILSGLKKNTVLNELFSDNGVGTMII